MKKRTIIEVDGKEIPKNTKPFDFILKKLEASFNYVKEPIEKLKIEVVTSLSSVNSSDTIKEETEETNTGSSDLDTDIIEPTKDENFVLEPFVGHGKNTVGGKGGKVYNVTTLNDSGTGSLREAVKAKGKRIINFLVSGNIKLEKELKISNPNITIDGSTAPKGGVAIIGHRVVVGASEVILQNIRVRLGDNGFKDADGKIKGSNSGDLDVILIVPSSGKKISNIVIDHCSVSWGIDECLSSYGGSGLIENVSIINNIVSQGLDSSHHKDGSHSMASLFNFNTKNISVINNLYYGSGERHLRLGAGVTIEFHNNLVYGFSDTMVVGFGTQVDMVGNTYLQGNYPLNKTTDNLLSLTSSGASAEPNKKYTNRDSKYYLKDNYTNAEYQDPNDSKFKPVNANLPEGYINKNSGSRLVNSGYEILPRLEAIDKIISNSGAFPRDSYDSKLISNYKNKILADKIDTQEQVGGFPDLN